MKETICGHDKYYAKDMCRKCYEKDLKRRNPEYHERQKQNVRKWARENPDRKKRSDKAWARRQSYEYRRKRYLKNRYGISIEEYNRMCVIQDNKCAICGVTSEEQSLCIDHCHKSGKIRGLLCRRCNSYIGLWRDDVELLRRAALYLEGIDGYGCEVSAENRKDINKKGILSSIEDRAKSLNVEEKYEGN